MGMKSQAKMHQQSTTDAYKCLSWKLLTFKRCFPLFFLHENNNTAIL